MQWNAILLLMKKHYSRSCIYSENPHEILKSYWKSWNLNWYLEILLKIQKSCVKSRNLSRNPEIRCEISRFQNLIRFFWRLWAPQIRQYETIVLTGSKLYWQCNGVAHSVTRSEERSSLEKAPLYVLAERRCSFVNFNSWVQTSQSCYELSQMSAR